MSYKGCEIKWLSESEISIEGIIDEYADFSSLTSRASQVLRVDLSKITRINSSGIRSWIQTILRHKIQLSLRHCSPVVVEQFSMIPEFIGKNGFVESFYGHFVCNDCSHETTHLFQCGVDVIPGESYREEQLEQKCPSCSGTMELDHNPEIYFAFLRSMKPRLPQKAS